jgi:hypothetical protein
MKTCLWSCLVLALTLTACDSNSSSTPLDGSGSGGNCSFENCNGCCDGDRCVTAPNAAKCGLPGAACQACESGDTCAAGQCVPIADCSDCDGCCLDGTQCVPGDSLTACGAGGAACAACGAGTGCDSESGTCEPIACDASNCDGCCTQNGVCITLAQQTTGACGADGDACEVCSASASACTQGTCVVDQPCLDVCTDGCCTATGQCIPYADQDNDECGGATGPEVCGACNPALSCVSGDCVADLAWRVTVVSAVIDATKAGAEWDQTLFTNPLPDAYAGLALANDTFLDGFTPTIDNTLTPNWNHAIGTYLESDLIAQGLGVNLRDSDGLGVFETIGNCTVAITAQNIAAGFVVKPTCGYATSLRISFSAP